MSADFLVIGAQKCGTTTLYKDLRSHSGVFIPDKETSALLDRPGAEEYARIFARARPGQLKGEVATTYSMIPEYDGVAEVARSLAPEARIVYIVRNPVERVVSHHYHDLGLGLVHDGIDQAVHNHPALLQNSRYATQLTPWVECFGSEAVAVIRFEDYMAHRQKGARRLQELLGLSAEPLPSEEAHNTSDDKRVPSGFVEKVSASPLYRRVVRPLVSERVRRRVTRGLSKEQPDRPSGPSNATLEFLVAELTPEVDELARLTGHGPMWDLSSLLEPGQD